MRCSHRVVGLAVALSLLVPVGVWAQPDDRDPAIRALVESRPATPENAIRVARTLLSMGRPALGKPFLEQVLEANLDRDQRAALADSLGMATFYELADQPDLRPESTRLLESINQALAEQAADADFVAAQIDALDHPNAQVRAFHMRRLRRTGDAAVQPLLERLATADDARFRGYLRDALTVLGPLAVPPLEAVVHASTNTQLAASAASVLGRIGERTAVPYLIRPAFETDGDATVRQQARRAIEQIVGRLPEATEALTLLVQQTRIASEGRRKFPLAVDNEADVWTFDDATNQLSRQTLNLHDASWAVAAQWAADAWRLNNRDSRVRQLYLETALQRAAIDGEVDNLPVPLDEFSTAELLDLVDRVARTFNSPAAIPAVAEIARRDEPGLLDAVGGELPVLAKAAVSPDPRLRLAAIEAILALDPDRPFAGASYVIESLAFLSSTSGVSRAVVASPNRQDGRELGGLLESLGYRTYVAHDGRDLFRHAAASLDTEVVLVGVDLGRPPAEFALDTLRLDPRTEWIPAGVVGFPRMMDVRPVEVDPASIEHEDLHPFDLYFGRSAPQVTAPRSLAVFRPLPATPELTLARRVARYDRLAEAIIAPAGINDRTAGEILEYQLAPLLDRRPRNVRTTPEERLELATRALGHLARLTEKPGFRFDLGRALEAVQRAAFVGPLREDALQVLAGLQRAEAQATLIEVAILPVISDESRSAAVEAYLASLQRFGPLMGPSGIVQLERTARSPDLPDDLRNAAAAILDAIEDRARPQPAEEDQE